MIRTKRQILILGIALLMVASVGRRLAAQAPSLQEQRGKLTQAFQAGNYKEAYEGLRKLALDAKDDPQQIR